MLREYRRICLPEVLAKPRAWEGQRPRCPRFAAVRATRTFPLPGFCECLYKRRRINENMVWTDSQDYDADEILYTARTVLFDKTNRLMREITILFEVYPRLFRLFPGCSSQRVSPLILQTPCHSPCGSLFAVNINFAAHHEPQMWYNSRTLSRKEVLCM